MTRALTILVVDDDEDNACSLGELFELEGHRVTVAHSGEAAISAYTTTDFDLAFMDVMMPGMNGVESFLAIRRLRPEAKVFMMTGYSVEQLLLQAMEHGAMGVLNKPIDIDKLLRSVSEVKPSGIVLVAEDGPEAGAQMKSLVESAGMRCGLVSDENDAVTGAADLTIIDIGKPLIDSVEVYARLRRQGCQLPAIIVTRPGAGEEDMYASLRDLKVTGILNKPFDPRALIERLEALAA
jgi:CheY-like chemotaxis protein